MICLLTAATLAGGHAFALSSGESLQKALYAEQIEGNLEAAIANYEAVINDASASDDHVAQALYRQGLCYLQLERENEAIVVWSRLMSQYPGQTGLIQQVKPILEELGSFDPASFMPPETLAYFEMGDIGGQIETLFELLKGTPLEDPLKTLAQNNPEALRSGPGPLIAGLLNPAMKEDFQKLGGLAVGVTGFNQEAPAVVGVLNMGKSSMLRGLMMTGLSMLGNPGPAIEGVQTYSIDGKVEIACDDQVFMVSFPAGQLPWMIRQYKYCSSDKTLAGEPSFQDVSKTERQHNLATLWMDTDGVLNRVIQLTGNPGLPEMLTDSLMSMDDVMLALKLNTESAGLDARIKLKEGMQNPVYEMIKTPPIALEGLKGIPADAVGILTLKLPDSGSAAMMQLQQLLQENAGLNLPGNLIDSLGQITVFALPYEDLLEQAADGIAARFGMLIECSDPSLVIPFVEGLKPMLSEQDVFVEVVDHAILFSTLNPMAIDAVKSTLGGAPSIVDAGLLKEKVNECAGRAEKLILVNAGGVARWAGSENLYIQPHPVVTEAMNQQLASSYEKLADALESVNVALSTDEQENTLNLQLKLDGLASIPQIVEAVRGVIQEDSKISVQVAQLRQEQARERAFEQLKDQRTATICELATGKSLKIDGELDERWTRARVYPIDRPVQGQYHQDSFLPGSEFAAEFRTLYDPTNLYVFIDVTDNTPNHNPDLSWQFSDNAILYIDASGAKHYNFGLHDFEITFRWDAENPVVVETRQGSYGDEDGPGEYVIKNTDKGYCIEAAIPWYWLGTMSTGFDGFPPGTAIGLDVQVSDNQAGTERNAVLGWQDDTNQAWLHPNVFGRAELGSYLGMWPRPEQVMEEGPNGEQYVRGIIGHYNGKVHGQVTPAKGFVYQGISAIDLAGPGSYVEVEEEKAFDVAGEINISGWIKIRSIPSEWSPILTKGNTSWRLSLAQNEAKFHFGLNNQSSGGRVETEHAVSLNEWHYVSASFDGEMMRIYVDGKLDGEAPYDGVITSNDCPVMIGANSEAMDRGFDGQIEALMVCNIAQNVGNAAYEHQVLQRAMSIDYELFKKLNKGEISVEEAVKILNMP